MLSPQLLVRLLIGVFDPPPDGLSLPWIYLAGVFLTASAAAFLASTAEPARSRNRVTEKLRGTR